MKDKGIYYTLLLIIVVGVTITTCTNYFLKNSSKTGTAQDMAYEQEKVEGEFLDLEPEVSEELSVDAGSGAGRERAAGGPGQEQGKEEAAPKVLETTRARADSPIDAKKSILAEEAAQASYFRNRLSELDAQIQKNRENQSSQNTNSSAKNVASNELKLWDNELNTIYDEILEHLDENQAKKLVEEEREWMKERDRLAVEAAKALSGASLESVEYTTSQAESTRLRAYELVNSYEYLLVD